jgi:hypothetical protein
MRALMRCLFCALLVSVQGCALPIPYLRIDYIELQSSVAHLDKAHRVATFSSQEACESNAASFTTSWQHGPGSGLVEFCKTSINLLWH